MLAIEDAGLAAALDAKREADRGIVLQKNEAVEEKYNEIRITGKGVKNEKV